MKLVTSSAGVEEFYPWDSYCSPHEPFTRIYVYGDTLYFRSDQGCEG